MIKPKTKKKAPKRLDAGIKFTIVGSQGAENLLEYDGEKKTRRGWSEHLGVSKQAISQRIDRRSMDAIPPAPPKRFDGPRSDAPHSCLARILTGAREMENLSQVALGFKIGTSQSSIAKWESGRVNITERTLRRYATGLSVSPEAFLRAGLDRVILTELPEELRDLTAPLLASIRRLDRDPSSQATFLGALQAAAAAIDTMQNRPAERPTEKMLRGLDTILATAADMRVEIATMQSEAEKLERIKQLANAE